MTRSDTSDLDPDDELLSRYLDQDLSPDDRHDLEGRLGVDPVLQARLDAFTALSARLDRVPYEVPDHLVDEQIERALQANRAESRSAPATVTPLRPYRARRAWGVALSAAALLAAVTVATLVRRSGDGPAPSVELATDASPQQSAKTVTGALAAPAVSPATDAGQQGSGSASDLRDQSDHRRDLGTVRTIEDLVAAARQATTAAQAATGASAATTAATSGDQVPLDTTAPTPDPSCGDDLPGTAVLDGSPVRWGLRATVAGPTMRFVVVRVDSCVVVADRPW